MKKWWAALLDLLYPPRCPACRNPVTASGLCPRCLAEVAPGVRYINVRGHGCRYLDACLAVTDYTGAVKRLLHDLKFRAARYRVPCLADLLLRYVPATYMAGVTMALPVPLHPARQRQRGFNQTELLFAPLLARYRLASPAGVLVRCRDTAPQWTLDRRQRRQNIRGAFAVREEAPLVGENILLLDDIFTTGLTLDECARVLKKHGAPRVYGLVLATGGGIGKGGNQ